MRRHAHPGVVSGEPARKGFVLFDNLGGDEADRDGVELRCDVRVVDVHRVAVQNSVGHPLPKGHEHREHASAPTRIEVDHRRARRLVKRDERVAENVGRVGPSPVIQKEVVDEKAVVHKRRDGRGRAARSRSVARAAENDKAVPEIRQVSLHGGVRKVKAPRARPRLQPAQRAVGLRDVREEK